MTGLEHGDFQDAQKQGKDRNKAKPPPTNIEANSSMRLTDRPWSTTEAWQPGVPLTGIVGHQPLGNSPAIIPIQRSAILFGAYADTPLPSHRSATHLRRAWSGLGLDCGGDDSAFRAKIVGRHRIHKHRKTPLTLLVILSRETLTKLSRSSKWCGHICPRL